MSCGAVEFSRHRNRLYGTEHPATLSSYLLSIVFFVSSVMHIRAFYHGKVVAHPSGWEPGETLANFVHETGEAGETIYTDDHRTYKSLREVLCTIR